MSVEGWLSRAISAGTMAVALAGCGGSGGNEPAPPSATLSLSVTTITVSASVADAAPTAQIDASVQTDDDTMGSYQYQATSTNQGIDSVSLPGTSSAADYVVAFKSPAALGPGTYTDTLTIVACYDTACTRPVKNSPQSVTVTYTVTAPPPPPPPPPPPGPSLTPSAMSAGGPAFVLGVSGTDFVPGSIVLWNGSLRSTQYLSPTLLLVNIAASDIATAGTAAVTVAQPDTTAPGSAATFTINAPGTVALSLSLSTTRVSSSSDAPQPITTSPSIVVAINGAGADTYYYQASWTGSALRSVAANPNQDTTQLGTQAPTGPTTGRITAPSGGIISGRIGNASIELTLTPQSDQSIGSGSFTDTLTILACTDAACTQPIGTGAQQVTFNYTIAGNDLPEAMLSIGAPLRMETDTSNAGTPVGTVLISSNGLPPAGVYVVATAPATGAIAGASVQSNLDGTGTLSVMLKSPQTLGSGLYTDNLNVQVCFDPVCAQPVSHAQFTVPVTYIVDATAGIDFTSQTIAQQVVAMVWSAANQRIYAVTPSAASAHPNSLLTIDPASAAIEHVQTLTSQRPTLLAVSDDGAYVYVCSQPGGINDQVLRIKLSDDTIDQTLPLSGACHGVAVAPGQPHTVAVNSDAANVTTLSVYDDAVKRSGTFSTGEIEINLFATWGADAATLYAYDNAALSGSMYRLSAAPGGLTVAQQSSLAGFQPSSYLYLAGTTVVADTGAVYDTLTGTTQAPFTLWATNGGDSFTTALIPDASLDRAYALTADQPLGSALFNDATLQGFDLATRQPTWITRVAAANGQANLLLRWGTNGLAYQTVVAGQHSLVLLSGAVVAR